MAEDLHLTLVERTVTGKAVKHLRREGQVPAVIHDHGKASLHVSGAYLAMAKAFQQAGTHQPVELQVGNKKYTAIIKDVAFEPRKHQLTHVVFGAVDANEKVTTKVPIKLSEEIPAEKVSLVVITQLDEITVQAFPKDLPDEIVVDASNLKDVGDKLTVADLKLPKGVELGDPELSEQLIAVVYEPSALAAANDAAGGTPEAEDAAAVPSDHESTAVEGTQAAEDQPGGKKQFEPKGE